VPGVAGANASFGVMAAKALEEGKLDGFWANGMGAEVAVRNGVGTLLLDARRGEGPQGSMQYTFPAFVTTQKRLDNEPQQVASAVRAIVAAQQALKANPALATEAAAKHFPDAERGLITELIRRDAPFYDAAISKQTVDAMNGFARGMGILSGPASYEQVVAVSLSHAWRPQV
jgi:NitT/TauT family transport system substrate-binding protein